MSQNVRTAVASFAEALANLGGAALKASPEGRAKWNTLNGLWNLAQAIGALEKDIAEISKKVDGVASDVDRVKSRVK